MKKVADFKKDNVDKKKKKFINFLDKVIFKKKKKKRKL
jgi:hypothetical protein